MLALIVFTFVASAHAETRVALVIGNSNYTAVPRLPNPEHDASAMARVLTAAHFAVTEKHDLGEEALRATLEDFQQKADSADVALIYFAGHGLAIGGVNYVIPVDARLAHDGDVKLEAIDLDLLREIVSGARNLRLVFVDACRNNPFLAQMQYGEGGRRAISRGLARIDDARPGEVVFFSAKDGTEAEDGKFANSPFAAALERYIPQQGLELGFLIRDVSDDVFQATGRNQQPYAYASLSKEPFYFIPPSGSGMPTQLAPAVAPVDPRALDLAYWDSIKNSQDTSDFEAYLAQYPKGTFAGLARNRIAKLKKAENSPSSSSGDQQVALAEHPPRQPESSSVRAGTTFRDCNDVCPEMVAIPAGSFTMGPTSSQDPEDKGLQHRVTISYPFAVGKYDVTFAEWDACVAAGGCNGYRPEDQGWGRDNRPVINVSWDDSQAYVTWLSRKTGKQYRLLSESEWEYAARAGTMSAWFWGDDAGSAHANCNGCGSQWDAKQTSPVGSFSPNAFGLYDMEGNVWQWTQDCWNKNYGPPVPWDGSAALSGDCSQRVLRGGSWFNNPQYLRSAYRFRSTTTFRFYSGGFRVARTY